MIDSFYASTFQREPSFEELIRELQILTSDDLEDIQKKKTALLFQKVLSTLGLKLSKVDLWEIDEIFRPIRQRVCSLIQIGEKLLSCKGNSKDKVLQEDETNKALILSLKDQLYKEQEKNKNLEVMLKLILKENTMVNQQNLDLQEQLNSVNEQNEKYDVSLNDAREKLEKLANAYYSLDKKYHDAVQAPQPYAAKRSAERLFKSPNLLGESDACNIQNNVDGYFSQNEESMVRLGLNSTWRRFEDTAIIGLHLAGIIEACAFPSRHGSDEKENQYTE